MLKKTIVTLSLLSLLNASSYDDWLKSQNNEYTSYKKTMDDEFSDMLKKDWKAFKTMSSPSPYKKPKPITIPTISKPIVVPKKDILHSPKVEVKPFVRKKIITPTLVKKINYPNSTNISFDFYGEKVSLQYDKKMTFRLSKIDKNVISKYWETISKTKYKKLLKQINSYSTNLNLNDWAKYQFINKLGNKIYQDKNTANLFTWFILAKLNYDVKVGYNKNDIYLLSTMQHSLYQIAFFKLKNKKYYVLTPKGRIGKVGNIYTYAGNYPKATKKLSFTMNKELKLYNGIRNKKLSFKFQNKSYSVNAKYSSELVKFYSTFPQSDYNIYFGTKNSPALSNTLLSDLQKIISGKSEIEAVNLLLRFVQKSFAYKTDQKQFDYEKVMFPEETIAYPYSDCEDRSIMFSYLVKNLLKLDVVGLKYKDHLATAVAFSSIVSGDGFNYKGKHYTVSDPTYINANTGMTMPQYKNSNFKIISL